MSDWEDDVGEGVGPNRHIDNAAPSYERTNDYKDDSDYNGRGRSNRGGGQSRSHYGEGDNYDQYQKQDESSNDYGSGNSRYRDNADRGDRGDRGGRGDWGGRGGRGGRSDRGDRFDRGDRGDRGDQGDMEDRGDRDDWGDRGDRGDRGGRGRGRGSFRGGRGGGRRFDSEDGGGDGGDEGACGGDPPKPRELYIPPDPTDNEQEMFGSGISTGINFAKYEKIDVKVSGNDVPLPIKSFESANLRKIVLENIQSSKYTTPTPIQKYTLPIVMSGRDVMGCAQTGSGKTASFLIPIINIILADPELIVAGDHIQPQCIIVTPTRELTIQIYNEARKFSHRSVLKVCVAYGGTGVRHQADRIMNGCHILVGTPGRLMDFLRRGRIQLCAIKFIVLDEADRMLDMGFLPEIEKLMGDSSMSEKAKRQTLMFSATFPETVQQVAAQFLDNYVFIAVGIVGGACSDVNQNFFEVERFKKKDKLIEILNEDPDYTGVIVFVETRRNADYIAALLSEQGIPTTSIHGDRLQREREEALRDFKQGTRGILVATGVASRGLDIKNVRHVINYDLPKSIDEYVHRIGRTGRVGNEGKATSFYDYQQDRPLAGDLVKILTDAGQPIPDFLQSVEVGGGSSDAYGGRDMRGDNYGGGGGNVAAAEPEEEW